QLALELGHEFRIVAVALVRVAQFPQRVHQRLGDEDAAVGSEMARRIGQVVWLHQLNKESAARTAAKNRRIFSTLLMPGASSMPLDTSTACGRTVAIACPTFDSVSPPASTSGLFRVDTKGSRAQSKLDPLPPYPSAGVSASSPIADAYSRSQSN